MKTDWEDADMFSEDDHSESLTESPALAVPSPTLAPNLKVKPPRRIRVKPMSAGMRLKWPEVSTCLLTLDNGRQIMFVR